MNSGDPFTCPACGEQSFLKKEIRMDGWKVAGEIFRCALCNAEISLPEHGEPDAASTENAAKKSLLSLLGETEQAPDALTEALRSGERKFCKDCSHRVVNAFRMVCSLHGGDVNPMDDCPDFVRRKTDATAKSHE